MSWRILCYHAIARREVVSLRAQLVSLLRRGCSFCSLTEGLDPAPADRPRVTVTFDDGDATILQNALPVLAGLSIRACLFVVTGYAGRGVTFRDAEPRPAMDWDQLGRWLEAGHEIGSHTHTHALLTRCGPDEVAAELIRSCELLRSRLGITAHHFAYPWGQHTVGLNAFISGLGLFRSLATIERGANTVTAEPVILRRDVISPAWSPARLAAALAWGGTSVYSLRRRVMGTSPRPLPRWLCRERVS